MSLLQISEKRNEMQKQQRSIIGELPIPYSLAKDWIETERAYQIKLANIEAAKQASIIKDLTKEIENLKKELDHE